jgi:hypothetical protein
MSILCIPAGHLGRSQATLKLIANPQPGPKEIIAISLSGARATERHADMGLDHPLI